MGAVGVANERHRVPTCREHARAREGNARLARAAERSAANSDRRDLGRKDHGTRESTDRERRVHTGESKRHGATRKRAALEPSCEDRARVHAVTVHKASPEA